MIVQVRLESANGPVLHYEAPESCVVGMGVEVPYGNWDPRSLQGIVVALGRDTCPTCHRASYDGPVKSILRMVGLAEFDDLVPERTTPLDAG